MNTIALHYLTNGTHYFKENGEVGSLDSLYIDKREFINETSIYRTQQDSKLYKLDKKHPSFYEIFIDGIPLSSHLDAFYGNSTPILYNWVGRIGALKNSKKTDVILIKQLLKYPIDELDIVDVYNFKNEGLTPIVINQLKDKYNRGINNYFHEIKDAAIHIYGCPECGEIEHGGYFVKVKETVNSYVWEFDFSCRAIGYAVDKLHHFKKPNLKFKFDKQLYRKEFESYLQSRYKKATIL